jgi:predicted transcriptional regulator of viral defense system
MLADASLPEPYIANKIYSPSYVSLEFALSYYGVIPETVYEITSVTVKAPRRFEILGKIFSYRKIKKGVFSGYGIEKQNDLGFYIADAQKAFVDANYFRWLEKSPPLSRFNKEKIDVEAVKNYAKLFGKNDFENFIKKLLQ